MSRTGYGICQRWQIMAILSKESVARRRRGDGRFDCGGQEQEGRGRHFELFLAFIDHRL